MLCPHSFAAWEQQVVLAVRFGLNSVEVDSYRTLARWSVCPGAENWLAPVVAAFSEPLCVLGSVVPCKAEQRPPWDTLGTYTTGCSEKMPCREEKTPMAVALEDQTTASL